MIVGSVREIKDLENRVALIPAHVYEYVQAGHRVIVEKDLGIGSGFSNKDYVKSGAVIYDRAEDVWRESDMIIKVKEPLESEFQYLRKDLILFTYLHLASNKKLCKALLKNGVSAIAYETVTDQSGGLPLLNPMSEVAGRLSIQQGMKYLESQFGGKGILLSGVPGVRSGHVTIIGGGAVGMSAAKAALGTGANVTVLDKNLDRLAYIEDVFNGRIETLYSDEKNIRRELSQADLVIGSVLIPGDKAPKLVRREHLSLMESGSVLVDVAIDQGGCFETSRPSTHHDPIYVVDGIVHYSVTNMPGAVPQTATRALANATLPYGLSLANLGLEEAMLADEGFMNGLNTYKGKVTHAGVAKAMALNYINFKKIGKEMKV